MSRTEDQEGVGEGLCFQKLPRANQPVHVRMHACAIYVRACVRACAHLDTSLAHGLAYSSERQKV